MNDDQEYIIRIYHKGVHFEAPIRGMKRYVDEKAFLNHLLGWERPPDRPPRPIPDPEMDAYILSDDQLEAYSAFRKRLDGAE